MFDIIIVHHNETNYQQHLVVLNRLKIHEPASKYNLYIRDNSAVNHGFAKANNIEASKGDSEFIALLNPDVWVNGPIFDIVEKVFEEQFVVVTGANFNKNPVEIHGWGLNDWVCGAAMFIRRQTWEELGGFDEQFVWSHEETDFQRRVELAGAYIRSLSPEELPILHSSPPDHATSPKDLAYKQYWMGECDRKFHAKWG